MRNKKEITKDALKRGIQPCYNGKEGRFFFFKDGNQVDFYGNPIPDKKSSVLTKSLVGFSREKRADHNKDKKGIDFYINFMIAIIIIILLILRIAYGIYEYII